MASRRAVLLLLALFPVAANAIGAEPAFYISDFLDADPGHVRAARMPESVHFEDIVVPLEELGAAYSGVFKLSVGCSGRPVGPAIGRTDVLDGYYNDGLLARLEDGMLLAEIIRPGVARAAAGHGRDEKIPLSCQRSVATEGAAQRLTFLCEAAYYKTRLELRTARVVETGEVVLLDDVIDDGWKHRNDTACPGGALQRVYSVIPTQ